ncbi:MAG: hypothetical protein IKC24_00045 [Oscillospiraceae bacterium]|nr:hypothetical protein [Oscillospiraceae bacterium]
MREILFRGKRTDNGEWVEGFYVGDTGDGCHEICDINSGTGHRVEVDPDTVGECSGVPDKNGKRIFEGDILLLDDLKGFVNYGTGCFCVRMQHPDYLCRNNPAIDIVLNEYPGLEVIGNIHDNPELLKGGTGNG